MVYFETNADLDVEQVEDIKKRLNEVLIEDLQVVVSMGKILWVTDDELGEQK